jgi:hypothetical protein
MQVARQKKLAEFEAYEIGPFVCVNCGNTARFKVTAEDSQLESHEYEEPDHPWGPSTRTVEVGYVYRMLICTICRRATFDRVFWRDGEPEDIETLCPESITVTDGLPEAVSNEYRDALNERRRNPNGYAALLGRVLDAVCTDSHIAIQNRQPLEFRVRQSG